MNGEIRCPKCHGDKFTYVSEGTYKCVYCGTVFSVPKQSDIPIHTQPDDVVVNVQAPEYESNGKSKVAAGLLAIFLGGLGIHWFYLGKTTRGIIYLLASLFFFWTVFVPVLITIISIIEGIVILTESQESFDASYN